MARGRTAGAANVARKRADRPGLGPCARQHVSTSSCSCTGSNTGYALTQCGCSCPTPDTVVVCCGVVLCFACRLVRVVNRLDHSYGLLDGGALGARLARQTWRGGVLTGPGPCARQPVCTCARRRVGTAKERTYDDHLRVLQDVELAKAQGEGGALNKNSPVQSFLSRGHLRFRSRIRTYRYDAPPWGINMMGMNICMYAPWGCGVRVGELTEPRELTR